MKMRIDRAAAAAAVLTQAGFLAIWWVLITGPYSGANVMPRPAPPPAFVVPLVLLLALPGRLLTEIPGSPLVDRAWLLAAFNLPFWYVLFVAMRALAARARRPRSAVGAAPPA